MKDPSNLAQCPCWFAWALASCLVVAPLGAELVCDGLPEGFDPALPAGWSVTDGNGSGLLWTDLASCGEDHNFTGGSGVAACASSDRFGLGSFDTALLSPPFDLSTAADPVLRFAVNYQGFAASDRLDVDLSTDQGGSWLTLLSLESDFGVFRQPEGETLEIDLAPWAGQSDLRLRFRYHDAEDDAFDWYVQIDDVALTCNAAACDEPPVTGVVTDGGFEAGTPNAAWNESSAAFGTPLCNEANCGFAGARTGEAWAFFGGAPDGGTDALEQDLTLPFGIAKLRFYLWIPAASANGNDRLQVLIDGHEVFSAGEDALRFRPGYRPVEIDVSAFADGGSHSLRFESLTSGTPEHTSFFVDDVTIEFCTAVVDNPEMTIDDVTLAEGNTGTRDAVFTVSLSGASRDAITVDFATADSTARVTDRDYQPVSGTLTFSPGSRTQTIAVPIVGDTVDEPTETFLVDLSGAENAVLTDAQALATLTNDDFSFLWISEAAALEREGASTEAVFTVTLSTPSSQTVLVDYESSDGTATAGIDYQAVSGTLSFTPGTVRHTIVVPVFEDERVERDETFFVDLSGPLNAVIDADHGHGTIIDNDRGRFPVPGTDVFYTETVDFEQGRFLNTHTDVPDQVQLTRVKRTFPNIWVAASTRGTIVRVDTRTGTILGEYSSNPDAGSSASPNPSRTTVALDGTVWAGNRGDGSVIHIGLLEENQCVDRNGNGTIETSSGYGDILPWPNAGHADSGGGVATAQDECILHYVKVSSSVTRHLSVDRDNNIWVSGLGGSNARVFDLVDGDSGQILRTEGPMPCGGYGGLVDADGVLWSAQYNGSVLRWDPAVSPPTGRSVRCIGGVASYGLAIDPDGDVWVAGPSGDRIWEISSDGQTVLGPFEHGSPAAQGLAVDSGGDVWISSAKWGGSATVGHVKGDGTFVGNVTGVPEGSSGVAIDIDGNVWTANAAASSLSRINPRLGPIGADGVTRIGGVDLQVALPGSNPYNYSDMTGSLALTSTSPQGTWQVIQDAGLEGTAWGTVTWNTEPEGDVPPDGVLRVEARAADTEAGLGNLPFIDLANGVPFDLTGRFIQVRSTLLPDPGDVSPVLSDLRITAGDPTQGTGFGLSIDNQTVFESDSGMLEAVFNVDLSSPGDGSLIEVHYDVFEGSATADVDYTPVSGRLVFPAGTDRQEIFISVFGDTDPEADETFFVKLRDPVGASLSDAQGVGAIVDDDLRLGPVIGDSVHYSLDEDFDRGRLFNAHHDAPFSDQLQVSDRIKPFPFIWIAASGRGTIVKIDTRTGAVLGEYSTTPDNRNSHDPSRTTVALDGSAWVGNRRDGGSVLHVGLPELNQCIDRNGNGAIETSTGYGDILPWSNPGNVDSGGGVTTARDECILHYVRVKPTRTRHVTLDRDNNVWISGFEGSFSGTFQLIDGQTGEILRTEGPFGCGGYGGFVDRNHVMWSSSRHGRVLRWDLDTGETRCLSANGLRPYGLGIGPDGWVWVSDARAARAWKISPDGNTVLGPFATAAPAQGLAVDENGDAWLSSLWTANRPYISHMKNDGTLLGRVNGVPRGSSGVAIDSNGKIWTANYTSRTASRIDPTKGPIGADGVTPLGEVDLVVNLPGSAPYNYSDMTGAVSLQATAPRGTWRAIQDGGEEGTQWGEVVWNTEPEAAVPDGASITAEARASDTLAGLGGERFVPVENGIPFALLGRYIEVRVTLRPNLEGDSPVLSDIRICTADLDLPAVSIDDVAVEEGDPGDTVLATFDVSLSQPSAEEVLVSYATIDGNATEGLDYLSRVGTLAFPPGITSLPVEIEILADALDEPDETFAVDLSFPRAATLADGQGIGTILDDDPSVSLTISGVTVEEGDPLPEGTGTVDAVFELTLDRPSNRAVRVDYATADGTAEVGLDYQEAFGYLEIPPGATSATITVKVLSDLAPEDVETFLLLLRNPDGVVLVDTQATGTILDDTLPPDVEITGVTDGECTATDLTPIIEVTDANLDTVTTTLNGESYTSGTPVTADGDYTLVVDAVDRAGNRTIETVTFTVDQTDPLIEITGVADGEIATTVVTPLFTATDPHLGDVTATLNGEPFTNGSTITVIGDYNLEVTADDLCGNRAVAAVTFSIEACDLYPIALHLDSLAGVGPGEEIADIFNGSQAGNFGWLTWTGDTDVPTLVASLTPPGDSDTYDNPDDPNDDLVSIGDQVEGKPGVSNAKAVRDALDVLKTLEIIVPVWDQARGQGGNTEYRVVDFARVRITDYRLPGQNRIAVRFLGLERCADR